MELKGLEKTAIKRIASTVSKTSQVNDQSVDRLLVDIRNAAKSVQIVDSPRIIAISKQDKSSRPNTCRSCAGSKFC